MDNISTETKEALAIALDHLLNATKLANQRMALFSAFKGANAEERRVILGQINSLKEKVLDAQLLLKLYIG